MRQLALLVLLALPMISAGPATAQTSPQDLAMTSLLKVCLPHVYGEPVAALIERARSGGFIRDPDRGGVLGERLTWTRGTHQLGITLTRADGLKGPVCRIEATHGLFDAAQLEAEVRAWALGARPPFAIVDRPRDTAEDMFGPKPVARTVFEGPAERIIVERFATPAEGAFDLLDAFGVVISVEAPR